MAAIPRTRASPPIASAIAPLEAVAALVLSAMGAARPVGLPRRRLMAPTRPIELLLATLVERQPARVATAVRVAGVPLPCGARPRAPVAKGRTGRMARGSMDPPGPSTALPRQARATLLRSTSEAQLAAFRGPPVGALAAVLDARQARVPLAIGQAQGPVAVGRVPAGVPTGRVVPVLPAPDLGLPHAPRAGTGVAEGVLEGVPLLPIAVAVGDEDADVRHPTGLIPGVLPKVAVAGEAGPLTDTGVRRKTSAMQETARATSQDTPCPTAVLVGTTPVAAVVVVPFLRLVVRKAVPTALPLRLVPSLRQRTTPLPQDAGAAHAAPPRATVGGRVLSQPTTARTVPSIGPLLSFHRLVRLFARHSM